MDTAAAPLVASVAAFRQDFAAEVRTLRAHFREKHAPTQVRAGRRFSSDSQCVINL